MTNQPPYNPGFMLPAQQPGPQNYYPQPPGYPPQQQQPGGYPAYPMQGPPMSGYPPAQTSIQGQPFASVPIGQPSMIGSDWYKGSTIQDYLVGANTFHVKQKVDLLEALVGWEEANRYSIADQNGHKILYAAEQQDCCNQNICGACRSFVIDVRDNSGRDLLRFERGLDCGFCCFSAFCPDSLKISTPNGQILGSVTEECHLIYPKYKLRDALGNTFAYVKGPAILCNTSCTGPVEFRLKTKDGNRVGSIKKEWGGLVREMFTDADNFSINFPNNMDPSQKAVCLGCLFLIDFNYFESTRGEGASRRLFG